MKHTLLILIIVTACGRTITLNQAQVSQLQKTGSSNLKTTLNNYRTGGTIRNNDAADEIFRRLGK